MFYVLKTKSNSKPILIVKRECIREEKISNGSNVTCYIGESIDDLPNPNSIYSILKATDEPKYGCYMSTVVLSEHTNLEEAQESIKTRNLKRSPLTDDNASAQKRKSAEKLNASEICKF